MLLDLTTSTPTGIISLTMEANRIRYWRQQRRISQARLAVLAGTNQNTVHKLETGDTALKVHHLKVFADALGVRPKDILPIDIVGADDTAMEIHDTDADEWVSEPMEGEIPTNRQSFVDFILQDSPNLSAWVLNSRALIEDGYVPGDVLIVDNSAPYKLGDVVCARTDLGEDASMVFRVYQPPFLIAASPDKNLRTPYLVDNNRVRIIGTVVKSIRNSNKKQVA